MKIKVLGLLLALFGFLPNRYLYTFAQEPIQNDILERMSRPNGSLTNNPITKTLQTPHTLLKSKKFYQDMLEDFCKVYYHRRYKIRSYVDNSLRVDGHKIINSSVVEVWGFHSYFGRNKLFRHDHHDFKATIVERQANQYKVTFSVKTQDLLGRVYWDTTEVPFTYNPNQ